MSRAPWNQFDNGATLGQEGSEGGVILRDEEHLLGARITLEQDGRVAPFAITCGIYGWLVHTRFFAAEDEANAGFEEMKIALATLVEKAKDSGDEQGKVLMRGCEAFVELYP